MNGYERFMAALRRETPDRIPLWELIVNEPTRSAWGATSLEDFVEQEDLDAITVFEDSPLRPWDEGSGKGGGREPSAETNSLPRNRPGDLRSGLSAGSETTRAERGSGEGSGREGAAETQAGRQVVDDWGLVWGMTDFGIPYPVTGPIQSQADLRRYTPPDPEADYRLESLRRAVRQFRGKRAIVFLTHDGFEFPHYLRGGMGNLLMDYIENPALAHDLAEMVLDYKTRLMRRAVAEGANVIVSGDDYASRLGPLMSPKHFQEFVSPYLKRSIETAHELGAPYIKHTDGDIWMLLQAMVDAGIDAIDPLEPLAGMDIGEVKRKFGDRIAVVGNVDCTELLPRATPDDVAEAVKETIAKAAPGGGFILASSNSIHPAVRPENYRAMVEAARRWGGYPLDQQMVDAYRRKDYIERWRSKAG